MKKIYMTPEMEIVEMKVQQLLAFTREMRHHYQEHYQQMCEAIENDNYWKPYRKYTETYEA